MATTLDILSEVCRPPHELVCAAAELFFPDSPSPTEQFSDEEPPHWGNRKEKWTIDGLLGRYDADTTKITIYNKGIEYAATRIGTMPERLKYVVRLHEWSHAVFHLGLDSEMRTELSKASHKGEEVLIRSIANELTETYRSTDDYVHEQIAQAMTKLALVELSKKVTYDESKTICSELSKTFEQLMDRQPRQYRLSKLKHLESQQLRRRVRDFIQLTRAAKLRAEQQTWDTLMAW